MYREPAIRKLHTQGVKLSTSCNATEGHTTSTKGQGIEIKYMCKAVEWNRMHVHVQRTSLAEYTLLQCACVCQCVCVCVCVCVCEDMLNVFHVMRVYKCTVRECMLP